MKRKALVRLLGQVIDQKDRQALFNILFFSLLALWAALIIGLIVRIFEFAAFGGV